jgi:prevent-host-death family protein
MKKIGLREANLHFSRYIKMVKGGKEIVLTDRGKPLAIIKPFKQEEDPEGRIRQMEEQGLLSPSVKEEFPLHKLVILKGMPLSMIVVEEREERI